MTPRGRVRRATDSGVQSFVTGSSRHFPRSGGSTADEAGTTVDSDALLPGASNDDGESEPMVLWPAVTLVGFLLLTALVIAMGTHSTARYEQEKRTAAAPAGHAAPEAARATAPA